jgi:hypothetical protein
MQHMAGCVKLEGPEGGDLHKRRIAGEVHRRDYLATLGVTVGAAAPRVPGYPTA